jgi:hypothetical protein
MLGRYSCDRNAKLEDWPGERLWREFKAPLRRLLPSNSIGISAKLEPCATPQGPQKTRDCLLVVSADARENAC